jgi:hypothetical protein
MSGQADLVEAALEYAGRGIPVFPCRADTKRPLTTHGFKEASTDPEQIRSWWRRWPNAMLACPTGPVIGAWVLDIDDSVAFEAACDIPPPATRKSMTGKGYHLWFRWDDATPVRNVQRSVKGWPFPKLPGAETRGEGGYVILPPSRHPNGRTYEWESDEPAAAAPAGLLEIIRAGPQVSHEVEQIDSTPPRDLLTTAVRAGTDSAYGLAALTAECAAISSARAGAQEKALNDGALKIGGLVGGGCVSFEIALAQLIAAGFRLTSHDADDPWTAQQITAKVERGLRDGMRSPRTSPSNAELVGANAAAVDRIVPKPSARPISATPYRWREPATIPLRPWVLGRWLLRGTIAAAVAPGGVGKTTFLAAAALGMVTARPLLGKTTWDGPKRIWIWNLEDDLEELQRAIQAAALHHAIGEEDLGDGLFVDSAMEGAGLCTAVQDQSGLKLLAPVYDAITAELTERRIDVLIIDPFVSSHQVEENDNGAIDKVAKAWARVAKAASASIVLVHHTSKAGAAEVTALSGRGAVSLINACRSTLVFNRMPMDVAQRLGIKEDERRRYFAVMDDKHNRAPAEKADWYRLASVPLGNGGLACGDEVAVAEPWTPPDPFENVTTDHLYRVQLLVSEGEWKHHHTSEDWVGSAVASVLGLNVTDKADKARIQGLLKTWEANGALRVEERRDGRTRQMKKFASVGRWANDTSATPTASVASHTIAVEHPGAPLHPAPYRGAGVAAGAAVERQVSQGEAPHSVEYPHGNPALKMVGDDDRSDKACLER